MRALAAGRGVWDKFSSFMQVIAAKLIAIFFEENF